MLGSRAVRLYPIYHPAAALYTPRMLQTLREDFARLPELLALGAPEQPCRSRPPFARDADAAAGRAGAASRRAGGSAAERPQRARGREPSSSACSRGRPLAGVSRPLSRPFWTQFRPFQKRKSGYLQDFPG